MKEKAGVQVQVEAEGWKRSIRLQRPESLLEALRRNGIFLSSPCGGRGACGKCRVRFLEGAVLPSKEEKEALTPDELSWGWRLACRAHPGRGCRIFLEQREEGFFVLSEEGQWTEEAGSTGNAEGKGRADREEYGIAADVGTTTIAMALVNLSSGRIEDVYTTVNRQRAYGADVISRIEASNSGQGRLLTASVREDLERGIRKLTRNHARKASHMAVSANAAMVHLLMGYSCEALGMFPFTPARLDALHLAYEDLFEDGGQRMEVFVFPGISTFVGGDVVAGLYALELGKGEKPSMLVDLGTNGEIAVGSRRGILAASTAAGPAFEGGSLACGTGSVPGAICRVALEGGRARIGTIGGAEPTGICGTGALEAVCELKRSGLMDESGRLEEPWLAEGFPLYPEKNIRLYQKDIRELQLAKAAVRAGMEVLFSQYGAASWEMEGIYIAGGLGHQLDLQKAVEIGLFPRDCRGKLKAVGNTSLKGVVKYLRNLQAEQEIRQIVEAAREFPLSGSKEFQELYLEHLCFA